jgi:uroporphyrin-III C-methyltransferase/precorrin-2 dehydrogenase/sirohydrochlorin ferrochelatase
MFPVSLNLERRSCLVVGGGAVGLRKAVSLIDAGARVTVVAPDVVPELEALAGQGKLALERREYRDGEAGGHALVFAATDRREVNRRVSDDARASGVFVNVADDPELCSFHLPARVRRGPLEMAVASGGGAPFLVRRLRQALEAKFGPEWAEWGEAAAAFRAEVRARGLGHAEQEACFDRFVASTLDSQRLRVRVPSPAEVREWIGAPAAASDEGPALAAPGVPEHPAGFVSLVGGGPGCAGLLTLKGRQRLLAADAVVYDRLAAGALPTDLPADVELHGVGKEAGHHPVPQEQINQLLVRLAREGKRVVRLKGGDPYVFGRGGEEAEALGEAGVPFEVVPGVTSGVAAAALAGIPVTHRREAVQVTLLTAHECIKTEGAQVRWDLLARQPDATLVGYMGVTALPRVVERLLAAGMDARTPAAMIEQGTTSAQRSVLATIATLPEAVVKAGLGAPALFVIGPTVRHADRLNWLADTPLTGERLAVPADAVSLQSALEEAGAELVPVPMPVTPAARVVLGARPLTGCLVRSAAEVEALDEECAAAGCGDQWTAWCLGEDASRRAHERGWRCIEDMTGATESEIVTRLAEKRRQGVAPLSSPFPG